MMQVQWSSYCLGMDYFFSFLSNRSLQENGDQKVESRIEEVSLLIVVICFVLRTPFHSFHIKGLYLVLSLLLILLKPFKALDLCPYLSF